MTAAAPSANGRTPSPREAAARYHGLGWAPIPVYPRSKIAVGDGWQNQRPTAEDLDRLFPAGADLNVGLLLGEPSGGLVDVDLDCPEAVAAAAILLPLTGRVSGRPGKPKSHYWYLVSDPPRKASEKFTDTDRTGMLELRSTGGQTVVYPSLHEGTGERVVWHTADDAARVKLPALRAAVRAVAAAAILARHWPAKGSRHNARLDLAGGLLRGGASEDFAVDFLTAVCVAARNQGVDDCGKVVRDTAAKLKAGANVGGWPSLVQLLTSPAADVMQDARAWLGLRSAPPSGAASSPPPRPPEPYRPFPTDALPQPLRAFVEQAAAALGCDPTFVALPALAIVASLIGNARSILLKRGWCEPAVVWSGVVGDSGTLKSPAVSAATGPLYRLQRELLKRFKTDMEEYDKAKTAWDERKKAAKKEKTPFDEEEPERPTLQRVVCGDTTIEKLAQLLEDNVKGLLVARDELGAWLASFQRYKGKAGGSDLPCWLEMSRAGVIQVDRKTGDRPTLFIQHAAVSITGGIQPGPLARALTAEHKEAGLAARLLMAMPPKRRKEWSDTQTR